MDGRLPLVPVTQCGVHREGAAGRPVPALNVGGPEGDAA
jgi:hypothetical protein